MSNSSVNAPKAKKISKELQIHGQKRIDNYYWLNEKENPEVIDYLNAENDYYHSKTSHTQRLQKQLFDEIKARIKEEDNSVPFKKNHYIYTTYLHQGQQYPVYCRKHESEGSKEEVLFDVNQMAKDANYFHLGSFSISPNNQIAAFSTDAVSRRQYVLQFKNLETGTLYPEKIKDTSGSVAWANDNKTIFYTKKDPETLRSNKIFRHELGTDPENDVEVFEESDETFNTSVSRTKSGKYIFIASYSTISTEYRFLSADLPERDFTIFQKREPNLEYSVFHYKDHFYVETNADGAFNFKLMKVSEANTSKENWQTVIEHREDVLLEDVSIFKDFLVLEERKNGICKIRVKKWDDSQDYYLPFDEEVYDAGVGYNPDFDSSSIRVEYSSMTTPSTIFDFDMNTQSKTIRKQQEVLGGKFNQNNYKSFRLWATAEDGVKVPMSVVTHKNTKINSQTPLLLYGYGSYGITVDPRFSLSRLSLLDRGFVFVIAHIRGGEYLGRKWYENGRMLFKRNSFTDFIACAEFLIENQYTSPVHLYASGGSAGGLLMGGVVNMKPALFNGVIADVPFVDVLTTMLDKSIPLTTGEYNEWGNPEDEEYYHYIKSYSPYDNLEAKEYPNMLVTTGLHDSQVQYFEPAKWVAKLRELKTDHNLLLLYTDMETGHGGASGRFDAIKDLARSYSFLIDLEEKSSK